MVPGIGFIFSSSQGSRTIKEEEEERLNKLELLDECNETIFSRYNRTVAHIKLEDILAR